MIGTRKLCCYVSIFQQDQPLRQQGIKTKTKKCLDLIRGDEDTLLNLFSKQGKRYFPKSFSGPVRFHSVMFGSIRFENRNLVAELRGPSYRGQVSSLSDNPQQHCNKEAHTQKKYYAGWPHRVTKSTKTRANRWGRPLRSREGMYSIIHAAGRFWLSCYTHRQRQTRCTESWYRRSSLIAPTFVRCNSWSGQACSKQLNRMIGNATNLCVTHRRRVSRDTAAVYHQI